MGAGHSHDTGEATPRNRLLIAFSITASVFVIEVIGAVITGSLALLVDAAHMLTDVIGLAMAVTAAHLMNRPPSDRYTFGLRRAEVLGAALRLAYTLSGGTPELLAGTGLERNGGRLVLRLVEGSGVFAGESVLRRVEALAATMGLEAAVEVAG